jgi:hypothetical protein
MLLFIYFNPVIGPDLLLSVPANITDLISEDDLDQIKRLMDSATPGFFTHAFKPELNTANCFFMIPSQWARGKQEMMMITKVLEEENPNLPNYELEFKQFINVLRNERPDAYKALYINSAPLNHVDEIKAEFDFLKVEFEKLAKAFTLVEIQTHGNLFAYDEIRSMEAMTIPPKILRDLESYLQGKRNYFVVFQKRRDSFKIDVIPYEKEIIVKIIVLFNGQLGPETLRAISMVFQEMHLPLIYTSGICQQAGKCIYEVYLDPQGTQDFSPMEHRLRSINKVEEIKIVNIPITRRKV